MALLDNPLGGGASLGLAMLLWPVVEALASFTSQRYSAFEIVWVRYGTHLVLVLLLWAPGGAARLMRTRRPGPALGVWVPLSLMLPWFWKTPTLRDLVLMMASVCWASCSCWASIERSTPRP